jgi:putative ABC transport system permease protein
VHGPGGRTVWVKVVSGPITDPMVAPRYDIIEGRLPQADGEVALNPSQADALRTEVGRDIDIPELGGTSRVVGIASTTLTSSTNEVMMPRSIDFAATAKSVDYFLEYPDSIGAVALERVIAVGSEYGAVLDGKVRGYSLYAGELHNLSFYVGVGEATIIWGFVAEGCVFLVLGVVISIAFTIGARRQLRTLGLIAANGGSPAVLRATVLWQGLWVGVAGSLLGLALGLGALIALWPRHLSLLDYDRRWWELSARDVVPSMLIGVGACVIASYLPARTAGKVSVLHALAGRRPLPPMRGRVALVGAGAVAVGLGLLALSMIGVRLHWMNSNVLAALALTGVVVMLGRIISGSQVLVAIVGGVGARVGGSLRLALRSIGRQRVRNGAVVSGVCAVCALVIAAATGIASNQPPAYVSSRGIPDHVLRVSASYADSSFRQAPPTLAAPPDGGADAEEIAALARVLGPVDVIDIRLAPGIIVLRNGQQGQASAVLATPDVIGAFGLGDAERQGLTDTGAIALGAPEGTQFAYFDGQQQAVIIDLIPVAPTAEAGSHGILTTPVPGPGALPFVLLTPERIAAAGRAPPRIDHSLVVARSGEVTDEQVDALQELERSWNGSFLSTEQPAEALHRSTHLDMPQHRPSDGTARAAILLGLVALVLTALLVAVGLALAAVDGREERDALVALGASPGLTSRVEGWKAATVAAVGTSLAVPMGILPVYVVANTPGVPRPVVPPWSTLVIVVVVAPVLIGLVTTGAVWASIRLRPVAASRFSDE